MKWVTWPNILCVTCLLLKWMIWLKSGCAELALKTQVIIGEVVGNNNWDCDESTHEKQIFFFLGRRKSLGLEDSQRSGDGWLK